MGSNILQQNLYSRLSVQMIHFSLLGFMFIVNFVPVENATFIALETQTLLQELFLFLTPPINKYASFLFFFLSFPYPLRNSPITKESKFILYAVKRCSYMTERNPATTQWGVPVPLAQLQVGWLWHWYGLPCLSFLFKHLFSRRTDNFWTLTLSSWIICPWNALLQI